MNRKRLARIIFLLLLLCCMPLPAALASGQELVENENSPLQEMLDEYRDEGYKILGPVQYLGRDTDNIKLFRHGPVSYRIMDMMDENGNRCYLERRDFVYVLSKDGHVVLIRLDRGDRDNV